MLSLQLLLHILPFIKNSYEEKKKKTNTTSLLRKQDVKYSQIKTRRKAWQRTKSVHSPSIDVSDS